MINLSEQKIEELAPNAAAAKNGRDLVAKKKFSNLKVDADKTAIWGECSGSGKNPYGCSIDFIDSNNPVARCNCPSRQFPCKHGLGLMYAYVQGQTFATAELPDDITSKREKLEKRQEKKEQEKESLKEKAEKPKKINVASMVKKIDAQLSGIELANKILINIVQTGLSSIDQKEQRNLQTQIKELGNYYIDGIQTAFNDLIAEINNVENDQYSYVIDKLNYISALLKKSKEYLATRKQNPEDAPELNSAIEEQIGYVWKLTELIQNGLYEENAELLQLSFNSYDDIARREFVDEGIWINMKTGKVYKTKNYRPYRAAKYIKEENSTPDVILLKELYVYPGSINPRVRWENEARNERKITTADLEKVNSYASDNYADVLKGVKNIIKNPLMDKNPLVLISLYKTYNTDNSLIAEDRHGNKLTLCDMPNETLSPTTILRQMVPAESDKLSLLVMINNDVQTGLLSAQPMTVITPERIVKLFY